MSVFAVLDGVNAQLIRDPFGKADAVIAGAEALLSLSTVEFFDAAAPDSASPVNRREDVHGGVLRDGANVGFGFLGKDDLLQDAECLPAFRIWSIVKPIPATTCLKSSIASSSPATTLSCVGGSRSFNS